VFRTTDVAEGELMTELLQREGIGARFRRVSAALIGAGPQIFETRVDVPVETEARARELLADLAYLGGAAETEAEHEADSGADSKREAGSEVEAGFRADADAEPEPEGAPPVIAKRRPLLAGIAFLVPGGGHFYARRPYAGLVLLVTIVYCYFK